MEVMTSPARIPAAQAGSPWRAARTRIPSGVRDPMMPTPPKSPRVSCSMERRSSGV